MKKTSDRVFAALILTAMLAGLVSCGGSEGKGVTTDSGSGDTSSQTETTVDIYADLPTGDYGNEKFSILNSSYTYCEYRLDTETQNGDTMNDAIFNRTSLVEEMLNIDIEVTDQDYWGSVANIMNLVLAGDDTYDACSLGVMKNVPGIMAGVFTDLYEVDEIDLDKPWWDSGSTKFYEIGGKLFTAHSDISANIHDTMWTCFFNKSIRENMKLDDIYELVRTGKWTLEKMLSLIETATIDLNGDNTMGADDQWGLMTHNGACFGFLHGADARAIDIENGVPFVRKVDDHLFDVITEIRKIFESSGTMTNNKHKDALGYTCVDGFANNKSLFLVEVLGNAAKLRGMAADFGIVPYPKYDESQENYVSYYSPAANGVCIPKTAKDISRSGTVVEVMSAIGYKLIRPAYYDVVLTSKTARDEESVEMLDIIFSNIESDMAYMYGWGGYSDALISVMTGSSDIMSTLEAKRSATEEAIKTYMSEIK